MMTLKTTGDLIRVVCTSTNAVHVTSSWVDNQSATPFAPDRTNTSITSTAPTTVVPSPAASTQRLVKNLVIYAVGGSGNTVTVQFFDGSSAYQIISVPLAINEMLQYEDGAGWMCRDANGAFKTVGAVGVPGPTGPQGIAGLNGSDGYDGDDGAPGPPGPAGGAGVAGSAGAAGAKGNAGEDGTDGADGFDSIVPGPRGLTGIQGPAGVSITGQDGNDGDDGVSMPGPMGPQGAAGSAGSAGPPGSPGPQGIPGWGMDGNDGDDGSPGTPGPAGPQGPQGIPGTGGSGGGSSMPGIDGNDGDDGVMAITARRQQPFGVLAPTFGATVNTDCSNGSLVIFTATSNFTLANPTGMIDGQMFLWRIKQDATGSRTITFGTNFRFGTDVASITLTTTASKTDYIGAMFNGTDTKWDIIAFIRGY